MLDRWLATGLFVALAALVLIFGRAGDLAMVLVLVGLPLLVLVVLPLLLHESAWQILAPRPIRVRVMMRWHRKGKLADWAARSKTIRQTRKLIAAAGLTLMTGDDAEGARLKTLLQQLVRMNLNAPSLIKPGLGEEALTAALRAAAPAAFDGAPKSYAVAIRKFWPRSAQPVGLVRRALRGLSYLCFGPGMKAVGAAVHSEWSWGFGVVMEIGDDWKTERPKSPAATLCNIAVDMLAKSGLPKDFAHLRDLPLARQRILIAAHRVLMGTPSEMRLAYLLNPSARAGLTALEAERRAHIAAMAEAKVRNADAATERAARETIRAATLTAEERTAILDRIALPGIHLRRVWPLRAAAAHRGYSWLGGRPCLPAHIDWPRGPKTGLPLHFLAQIDCAELPQPSALPPDGRLMFFADIDEEMLIDDNQGFAVIHVPAAQATDTERTPPDLPEIDHDGTRRSARYAPFRSEYPRWPVVAAPVTDYAVGQDAWSSRNDIAHAAHDLLLAQVVDLLPADRRPKPPYRPFVRMVSHRAPDGTRLPPAHELDTALLGEGYLRSWAIVGELVRALEDDAREMVTRAETSLRYTKDEAKRGEYQAQLDRAQAFAAEVAEFAGLDDGQDPAAAPPAEVAEALDEWLRAAAPDFPNIRAPISRAFLAVARRAAVDPSLCAALTPRIWRLTVPDMQPRLDGSHHMMLGATQRVTNSTLSPGVRLLCLDSDRGLGLNFCDAGVIEFWIDPADLAARRFDRVRAQTAGG